MKAKESFFDLRERHPIFDRFITDLPFRFRITLILSFGMNTAYSAVKFLLGIWYESVWFKAIAVYYFLLALMRFMLLFKTKGTYGENRRRELKKYLFCGAVLVLMNFALVGVVILVVYQNEAFRYAGYLIYPMAMYAFYNITNAVRNVVKFRKFRSPLMSAAKAVNLAAALVSMLSLETAMLEQFHSAQDPEGFRLIMTGCTGAVVCMFIFGMGLYMIVKAAGELKNKDGGKV